MNIPTTTVWEIGLAVIGFIIGTLWGHHGKILKRVTYEECSQNRENCTCLQAAMKRTQNENKKRKGKR